MPRAMRRYASPVDLDAYLLVHQSQWARLEELAGRRRLTGEEADELLDLYQRVSTHLSVVRSASPDPSVVAYLSSVLARARIASSGARTSTWADLGGFFTGPSPRRSTDPAVVGDDGPRQHRPRGPRDVVGVSTTPRCGRAG